MSEPKSSLEIMDVLSSIRRLVSEDRKGAANSRIPPAPPAVPEADADIAGAAHSLPSFRSEPVMFRTSGLPTETRFVLTAAHRVSDDAALSDSQDLSAVPTDSDSMPNHPELLDSADHVGVSEPDALANVNTLEDTIAELEAAVAGIEAEFEPDGGDAEELAAEPMPAFDPAPWRSETAAARPMVEYQGLMPSFDRMGQLDEPLDTPITGDLPAVEPTAPTKSMFWRASAPVIPLPISALTPAATVSRPTAEVARDEKTEHTSEEMEAVPVAQTMDIADVVIADDEPAVAPPEEQGTANSFDAGPVAEAMYSPDEPDEGADSQSDAQAGAMRLHLSERPQGRPVIVRGGATADEDENLATVDSQAADEDDDVDEDLFDPLAAANIDLESLRELVAEIVRDELRGTLGERITRNLRVLVRKEIGRALSTVPSKTRN